MNPTQIENYLLQHFADVNPLNSWGERSFFLNPGNKLKRGTYFATIKNQDGEHDQASNLNREGIFRLNIGISKNAYLSLFHTLPKRPNKGCVIEGNFNFQQINQILPHPIYAWMGWVCILNPDEKNFEQCKLLLEDAYNKALQTTRKKLQQ